MVVRSSAGDDKKLQSALKKLNVTQIPGVDQVNMIKDNGEVIHFENPRVAASIGANTFSITGKNSVKQITELLPDILTQLGPESMDELRKLAEGMGGMDGGVGGDAAAAGEESDEEVPELVESFDEAKTATV